MSIVKIRNHNENIYSLADVEPPKPPKPPKYHSKFTNFVRDEIKSAKSCHRTMGYAAVPLDEPDNFLKKTCGIRHQQPKSAPLRLCQTRRPPVPKRTDDGQSNNQKCCCSDRAKAEGGKNFRIENIKRIISAEPKRPRAKFCDTRRGDFQDLTKSGLIPVYVHKEKFGKVPKYLHKMKQMAQKSCDDEPKPRPKCCYVAQEERNEIMNGLKHNWQQLQSEYQKMSILTDTLPKKIRKTKLENQLKQLELDILLLERHPHIYIYEDTN